MCFGHELVTFLKGHKYRQQLPCYRIFDFRRCSTRWSCFHMPSRSRTLMVVGLQIELILFVSLCVGFSLLVAMSLIDGDIFVWEFVVRSGCLDFQNFLCCVDREFHSLIQQLRLRDFLNGSAQGRAEDQARCGWGW